MSQQVVNFAENLKNLLKDNWSLKDQLDKNQINWYSYLVDRKTINKYPIVIMAVEDSATLPRKRSLKIAPVNTLLKLDVFIQISHNPNDKERMQWEDNRTTIKNEIMKLIHDNQTGIAGLKFSQFSRFLRADEVDLPGKWFLHESIFILGEWYHTSS